MISGPTFVSKAPIILIFRIEISRRFIVSFQNIDTSQGCTNTGRQVAGTTEICTATLYVFGVLGTKLAFFKPAISQDFEVASRLLENLYTSDISNKLQGVAFFFFFFLLGLGG